MKSLIRFATLIGTLSVATLAWADAAPATATAPAASTSSSSSCASCACCDWSLPHYDNLYTDLSVSSIHAHKFNGYGASVRLGHFFNQEDTMAPEHKGHAVELELSYFHEKANARAGTSTVDSKGALIPGASYAMVGTEQRTVKVDMVPLMLNYRYHGSMEGWSEWKWVEKMRWYLGAGIGLNILSYDNHVSSVAQDDTGNVFLCESKPHKKTNVMLAGQLFGGVGYQCTDRLEIFAGLRGFFTDDKKFGKGSMTQLKVGKVHAVYDLGLNWLW